jgi:hypothetical protein
MSFLTRVEAAVRPSKNDIIPWVYGNCWSFAVGLAEVYGYAPQILANEDDLPDHAFVTSGSHAVDGSGVTTLSKLVNRFPENHVDEEEDDPYHLISEMSRDHSDSGYTMDDAIEFIKKYRDFYDTAKGMQGYELTHSEVKRHFKQKRG